MEISAESMAIFAISIHRFMAQIVAGDVANSNGWTHNLNVSVLCNFFCITSNTNPSTVVVQCISANQQRSISQPHLFREWKYTTTTKFVPPILISCIKSSVHVFCYTVWSNLESYTSLESPHIRTVCRRQPTLTQPIQEDASRITTTNYHTRTKTCHTASTQKQPSCFSIGVPSMYGKRTSHAIPYEI